MKYSTRMIPMTPALVMIPDSRALAGAGATGWAEGSQLCMGNRPAFVPKPSTTKNTASSSSPVCCPAMRVPPGAKSRVEVLV